MVLSHRVTRNDFHKIDPFSEDSFENFLYGVHEPGEFIPSMGIIQVEESQRSSGKV